MSHEVAPEVIASVPSSGAQSSSPVSSQQPTMAMDLPSSPDINHARATARRRRPLKTSQTSSRKGRQYNLSDDRDTSPHGPADRGISSDARPSSFRMDLRPRPEVKPIYFYPPFSVSASFEEDESTSIDGSATRRRSRNGRNRSTSRHQRPDRDKALPSSQRTVADLFDGDCSSVTSSEEDNNRHTASTGNSRHRFAKQEAVPSSYPQEEPERALLSSGELRPPHYDPAFGEEGERVPSSQRQEGLDEIPLFDHSEGDIYLGETWTVNTGEDGLAGSSAIGSYPVEVSLTGTTTFDTISWSSHEPLQKTHEEIAWDQFDWAEPQVADSVEQDPAGDSDGSELNGRSAQNESMSALGVHDTDMAMTRGVGPPVPHNTIEQTSRASPTAFDMKTDQVENIDVAPTSAALVPRRDVAAEIASRLAAIEQEERARAAQLAAGMESSSDFDDDDLVDLADLPKKRITSRQVGRSDRVLRAPQIKIQPPTVTATQVAPGLQGGKRFQARLAERALAMKYLNEPHDDRDIVSDEGDHTLASLSLQIDPDIQLLDEELASTDGPEPLPRSFFDECSQDVSLLEEIAELCQIKASQILVRENWQGCVMTALEAYGQARGSRYRPEHLLSMLRMSADLPDEAFGFTYRNVQSAMLRFSPLHMEKAACTVAMHLAQLEKTCLEEFEAHIFSVTTSNRAFSRYLSWILLNSDDEHVDDSKVCIHGVLRRFSVGNFTLSFCNIQALSRYPLLERMELCQLPLYQILDAYEDFYDSRISRYFRLLSVHWQDVIELLTAIVSEAETAKTYARQEMISWIERVEAVLCSLANRISMFRYTVLGRQLLTLIDGSASSE